MLCVHMTCKGLEFHFIYLVIKEFMLYILPVPFQILRTRFAGMLFSKLEDMICYIKSSKDLKVCPSIPLK